MNGGDNEMFNTLSLWYFQSDIDWLIRKRHIRNRLRTPTALQHTYRGINVLTLYRNRYNITERKDTVASWRLLA